VLPFLRRPDQFQPEAILKVLSDHPGHFVIGVVGTQGVGNNDLFLTHGHKTSGMDMYVCPERVILLDTEPLLCWSVLERTLRHSPLNGTLPDAWLEMECVRRAELLKFRLPDFPLLPPAGQFGAPDLHYYPDMVFVCNKCDHADWTRARYQQTQAMLHHVFHDTQLKIQGIGSLGSVLPGFHDTRADAPPELNLFFLPCKGDTQLASYDVLVRAVRDRVVAAPRRRGKKNHLSEKEWFKNAVKLYELVLQSDYILEYSKTLRKLRDPS
ncbi:hypothetical protein BC940DRAFT_232810, partial [Gongronella butleri]